MKRILLVVPVLMTGAAVRAQNGQQAPGTEDATLIAINRQFIKNFLNNDTIEHTRIIHPDFLFISKDGSLYAGMSTWRVGYTVMIKE